MSATKTKPRELRRSRRQARHGCWGHLIVAPLWVAYDANLGTLLRTCDAVGACLAVPKTPHYREALSIGDTLKQRRPCIHWVAPSKQAWLATEREAGKRLVAVELAEGATPLPRLSPARQPTIICWVMSAAASPTKSWLRWMSVWRFRWLAGAQA